MAPQPPSSRSPSGLLNALKVHSSIRGFFKPLTSNTAAGKDGPGFGMTGCQVTLQGSGVQWALGEVRPQACQTSSYSMMLVANTPSPLCQLMLWLVLKSALTLQAGRLAMAGAEYAAVTIEIVASKPVRRTLLVGEPPGLFIVHVQIKNSPSLSKLAIN